MLLTISSPSAAEEQSGLEAKTAIEFPAGRKVGDEKCFDLDGYKDLAIIYGRYLSCEAQKDYVLELVALVDDKQFALESAADDLTYALAALEGEQDRLARAMAASANIAKAEERKKRVWRAVAIGGLVVSLALGGATLGMGVSR
jgi:hypothetical protein